MAGAEERIATVGRRLFSSVLAPLVLGGVLRPGHAIGARVAGALAANAPARLVGPSVDGDLVLRVASARVARARQLAPIDEVGLEPTGAEWALAAALHDMLQAANPGFDRPLRRAAAARILGLAAEVVAHVPAAATVRDALSRHSFFARALEIARTDTVVTWWVGSRTFLGVEPPARLRAWPGVRRVRVTADRRALLDLAPLAFDRDSLVEAVAGLLSKTPITDLASCTRTVPSFAWSDAVVALIATRSGLTIALRALARLPAGQVDAVLGRATRDLFARNRGAVAGPALALLAERALADAQGHLARGEAGAVDVVARPVDERHAPAAPDAHYAQALGAVLAQGQLQSSVTTGWSEHTRSALLATLEPLARSEAASEALSAMQAAQGPAAAPVERVPT
jgi:hypothetical protein